MIKYYVCNTFKLINLRANFFILILLTFSISSLNAKVKLTKVYSAEQIFKMNSDEEKIKAINSNNSFLGQQIVFFDNEFKRIEKGIKSHKTNQQFYYFKAQYDSLFALHRSEVKNGFKLVSDSRYILLKISKKNKNRNQVLKKMELIENVLNIHKKILDK